MNSGLPRALRGAPDVVAASARLAAPHRTAQAALALVLALLLIVTLGQPASADDLTDQKRDLDTALARSEEKLDDFGQDLNRAASALDESRVALATARAELAAAESAVVVAKREDERQASELSAARYLLERARHEVALGQANIDLQVKLAGTAVVENAQQSNGLLGIAALVTELGTADLATRVQLTTVVFTSTQNELDRLSELQMQLQLSQDKLTAAEAVVERRKSEAAERLATTRQLEARASSAAAQVSQLVDANASAVRDVESQLSAEQARNRSLESEQAAVERRIAARIAAAKEAARKAAEAKRIAVAKAKAEAERKAAAAKALAKKKAAAAKAAALKAEAEKSAASRAAARKAAAEAAAAKADADKASSGSGSSSSSSSDSSFSMPVNGYITSYYGMRFHPVLLYWKLHDGVDFGAGCGTPIRAARSGVVTDRYYNAGYGNRLMIDHGLVSGSFITTGYNHASSYIVGVGQRVSRGQVIGYVGNTGFSTGCHLHLMVWEDGSVVNPLKWF